MAPQNALVARDSSLEHEIEPYRGGNHMRPKNGPANPFKEDSESLKRKNVPTGYAEEIFLSEHTFRSKHRAIERRGGPDRDTQSHAAARGEAVKIRVGREAKGDPTVVEGDGSYVGPWAKYQRAKLRDAVRRDGNAASEGDSDLVEDTEEEDDVVDSGTVIRAPKEAISRRKEVEEIGDETTTLHAEEFDYLGRTYMHVPQDLDVDLRKELGSITNYIPKRQIHAWKQHSQPVTALRFFPTSGHLLLSASADTTVRIFDVYHDRQLLRTYQGHNKSISDITFDHTGARFLSASYDRTIKLWDTEKGLVVNRFTTGKTPHVLRFSPVSEAGHEFLAGMSDNKIVQWDSRAGTEPIQTYDHHLAPVNTLEFYDQNRRFASTSDDRSVRCWEYNIPVPIKYVAEVDMFPLTRSARHPNGKNIAYQSSDNQIVIYGATDKFPQNRKKAFRGHNNAGVAIDVAISPDGHLLASGDSTGSLCFWDWKTCKLFSRLKSGEQPVSCLQWHPQETSKLVTAGLDGQIRYFD